jgi:hypothetical protein
MEEREPCPTCGATSRTFELSGSVSAAVAAGGTVALEVAQTRLRSYGYGIRWTEPTGPDGSWLIEVLDNEGKLIEAGMGDNRDDAILGVIESVLPPEG